ncbi:MAG TPA: hypothetical protein DCX14_00865 [Flavobacteriales bacterium]|nr:hypothetical protein [Flavobacteriales bacterium]HAW18709.1 hypothetical protein [Flavobacteriales bacterium]
MDQVLCLSNHVFLVHVVATIFMCGLCWFVQVVHYPLFREISFSDLSNYERKNLLRTSVVAIPVMVVEMLSGLIYLYCDLDPLFALNMGLFVIIGISTLVFQAPIHLQISRSPTPERIEKLIQTNWIRTIAWTIRVAILFIMLID